MNKLGNKINTEPQKVLLILIIISINWTKGGELAMRKKLNCIILVLAVGLSSISITTASTDTSDWSEDIRLTFNDARSLAPAIAVEGNNVHVAYIDDEGAGYLEMFLWYINSSDRGNTWNSPICLVNGPSTKI
ncbi:MAG: hypothetical protein JSV56_12240 [Methanomassiliicoccales archaeon]|nr:MAG: hypothetical protein JSV56_12240 [Methanomassiliicoccales archaeon]